jgi:hypothetical protein
MNANFMIAYGMTEEELKEKCQAFDVGIKNKVKLLLENGVETFESCEGGNGHTYPEPTIRFHGGRAEGFRALSVAMQNDLKVSGLKRVWDIIDGEPIGAWWEMVFTPTKAQIRKGLLNE